MPTAGAARRFGLTSPAACAVIGVVVLALFIAAVPLAGLAHQSLNASSGSLPVWVTAPFAVVGLVLAWAQARQPGRLDHARRGVFLRAERGCQLLHGG